MAAERGPGGGARRCQSILTFHLRRSATFIIACPASHMPSTFTSYTRIEVVTPWIYGWKDMLIAKWKLEAEQSWHKATHNIRAGLSFLLGMFAFSQPRNELPAAVGHDDVCRRVDPGVPSHHPNIQYFL